MGRLRLFFVLTFAISWGVGGLWLAAPEPLTALFGPFSYGSPAYLIAACAPSLVGLSLTVADQGVVGLKRIAQRLLPGSIVALVIAVATLPALALGLSLTLHPWPVKPSDVLIATPILLLTTVQAVSNSGPLGEEFGWRGYALPLMLERYPPLVAGSLLGLIWSVWHIPAFLFSGIIAVPVSDLGWYALGTVGLSLLMTWLHLRSGGSLLVAGLIPHVMVNALGAVGAWRTRPAEAIALFAVAVALLLARPLGRGRPREAAAPRP